MIIEHEKVEIQVSRPCMEDPEVVLEQRRNPLNWSRTKKWVSTIIIIAMTFSVSFCSSIYTAVTTKVMEHFGCSELVSTLGVTMFLLGFGVGSLLFTPLSEVWGRKPVYQLGLVLFLVFQVGCALAPNITAMHLFRFFAGFFGSSAVTNSNGSLIDIWSQEERPVPFALLFAASLLGPVIAPMIGSFVTQYTTWRWNFWIVLILGGVSYCAMFLFLPETYASVLLYENRYRSGRLEQCQSLKEKTYVNLTRPWQMLFTEPILFSLSLYMAFLYGILYLDFIAYPIVFVEQRHWSMGMAGLSFIGIAVGMGIATTVSVFINRSSISCVRKLSSSTEKLQPEARLPHLSVFSWFIPTSLFWFGVTARPPTHWAISIISGVPFGIGLMTLFLGITAYLTDCYDQFSVSVLTASVVFRSLFGAVFPLFAKAMYQQLGTVWAGNLLGFIALAMAPLPWVLERWGPALRERSAYHRL